MESSQYLNRDSESNILSKILKKQFGVFNIENYDKDFSFIFIFENWEKDKQNNFSRRLPLHGKRFEIKVPRFIADLISPNVVKLHNVDKTIRSYKIHLDLSFFNFCGTDEYQMAHDFSCYFQSIFYQNETYEVNTSSKQNSHFFRLILILLGNLEFLSEVLPEDRLNNTNIFERIKNKFQYYKLLERCVTNKSTTNDLQDNYDMCRVHRNFGLFHMDLQYFKKEIKFIAQHFYEIEIKKLKDLPFEMILKIIKNKHLCLENETQLYHFIKEMILISKDYYSLFSFIDFTFLKEEDIDDFITTFNFEYLDKSIWSRICSYFSENHKFIQSMKTCK
ncbi:hypothetical protein TRFO_26535 [Tritrichomonas foetus]|uniref:BACK domain-containing protein n=1 Tax=Tritrichomonas foetus TaxID=1144522 RepID=A0A1J4K2M9_9EUKA|nr:hypothetical protein TRFO_26535 [Tritrichomonas foetus]|eukprot:OHT05647.1 hypothetical protein TRFO_26535 [Tritrichomonas foetus]